MMGIHLRSAGFSIAFSPINWCYSQGFPKATNMGKIIDRRLGAEREVVGENPTWREAKRDNEVYQSVDGGSAEHITAPATEEAKYFEGSYAGFSPKPAYEMILVAMKPLSEPTYVDQALENYRQRQEGETTVGPGVTWLDDGRIPSKGGQRRQGEASQDRRYNPRGNKDFARLPGPRGGDPKGRFSPNFLVEDDVLRAVETRSHGGGKASFGGIFGSGAPVTDKESMQRFKGDEGSLSRYFDLDAWYSARQEMLDALPDSVKKTFPFLYSPKPSKSEKEKGCEGIWVLKENVPDDVVEKLTSKMKTWPGQYWWVDEPHYQKMPKSIREKWYRNGNAHVTIKPLKIMMYLIEIGSRPGDIVLDPFAGSGTTGVAAQLRSRDYLLIERDPRWAEISRRRLRATIQPLFHRKMK
jgi:site-specific DNA-methyltransferase (adenine-specific)